MDHRERLATICAATRPDRLFHGHYHIPYRATLEYDDSTTTVVVGLSDDDSDLDDHTLLITRDDV